jgi:hypothetical protein
MSFVADEGRLRHARVPPRAGMVEPGDHLVKAARPRHERVDLARRQYLGANIDDPPGQKGENLTALLVESKHSRSVLKTRGEEVEEGVHCCRPRTGRPVHRAADPPRAAHIASQPRRLPGFAPVGITHVCSIRCQPSRHRQVAPETRDCGERLRSPAAPSSYASSHPLIREPSLGRAGYTISGCGPPQDGSVAAQPHTFVCQPSPVRTCTTCVDLADKAIMAGPQDL